MELQFAFCVLIMTDMIDFIVVEYLLNKIYFLLEFKGNKWQAEYFSGL